MYRRVKVDVKWQYSQVFLTLQGARKKHYGTFFSIYKEARSISFPDIYTSLSQKFMAEVSFPNNMYIYVRRFIFILSLHFHIFDI